MSEAQFLYLIGCGGVVVVLAVGVWLHRLADALSSRLSKRQRKGE